MKPQEWNFESEIFDDFREKLDLALKAVMRNMMEKKVFCGTVTGKIGIEIKQTTTEDGEVVYMPEIAPEIGLKIGAKGKLDCRKQSGFMIKADEGNGFVIGSSQVSMDELLDEKRGA